MADQTDTQTAPEAGDTDRNQRKVRMGKVVSAKMDKTIVVTVERRITHPVYGKQVARTKKLHVHDEENVAEVGDTVRVMETRPISKSKRWRLVDVIERAK